MKKTQSFEIETIGEFIKFPIRKAGQEFKVTNKEGEELKRQSEGTRAYFWIDSKGNKYQENEVFRLIGNQKIQKVKRTEKAKVLGILDKIEITNLANVKTAILDYSETTLRNFLREIGEDKTAKCLLKDSSRGFKWYIGFIYKQEGRLLLAETEDGITKSQAIREFTLMKEASKKSKVTQINQVIEIKSEDLEEEISNLIKI